ncbi:MAG: hypothetical protein JF623_08520 [Acidobacteria bacterium]|jgi:hypothetical protein|nr:hypothetical protein [Acidobacteriota bacterium]
MIGKALIVTLAAAIVAVGFARHEDRVREQGALGRVASQLAGRPVGVHCPSFLRGLVDIHGDAGRVHFDAQGRPADHTDLSPETCRALRRLAHTDFSCVTSNTCGYAQFDAAWSAHALAHEAFHLRGYEDEGVAECYAMQNTAFVAEQLGVDTEVARRLQQWVWVKGFSNEPDAYRSAECRPGGALDLTPQTASWP